MNSLKAQDYLTALKVVREIQRKQAYVSGRCDPSLVTAVQLIELFCPLDFSKTGGRVTEAALLNTYNGNLFS